MTFRFGSVCSGIEAASVAWHPLGWQAAWLSEIEPFPSAVLAHHYPDVPNLGDMTTIADRIRAGLVEAPDMLCGGTPCQAFSVAGQRRSLSDERGNLSLVFCKLADSIDDQRFFDGLEPCIVFWENVPGVLSTGDNAFGCFLGQLAGEDCALEPPGGKWTDAGAVFGPKRAIAWRVLDAQYFGLAQRRRRVFVVASARKGFDPAAVLFEFDGVRRDSAPSREAREGTAASTARSVALRGREGGGTAELGEDCGLTLRASSGGGDKPHVLTWPAEIACTLNASFGDKQGLEDQHVNGGRRYFPLPDIAGCLQERDAKGSDSDTKPGHLIPVIGGGFDVAHSLRGEGFDASEDGTGRGTPLVPVAFNCEAQADQLPSKYADTSIHSAVTCSQRPAVAYAIQAGALRTNPASGPDGVGVQADHAYTQEARSEVQVVAIRTAQTGSNGWGVNTEGTAYTLDSAQQAVAFAIQERAVSVNPETGPQGKGWQEGHAFTLEARNKVQAVATYTPGGGYGRLDGGASPGADDLPARPMREMLGKQGGGASQERGLEGQPTGKSGAALPELPHEGTPDAEALRDLRGAAEGSRLLQQASDSPEANGRPNWNLDSGQGDVLDGRLRQAAPLNGLVRHAPTAPASFAVRRLTPREGERLQGFPDCYTAIPWRKKPASECPDGPRYKALGNSWAVTCVRWIGRRIFAELHKDDGL